MTHQDKQSFLIKVLSYSVPTDSRDALVYGVNLNSGENIKISYHNDNHKDRALNISKIADSTSGNKSYVPPNGTLYIGGAERVGDDQYQCSYIKAISRDPKHTFSITAPIKISNNPRQVGEKKTTVIDCQILDKHSIAAKNETDLKKAVIKALNPESSGYPVFNSTRGFMMRVVDTKTGKSVGMEFHGGMNKSPKEVLDYHVNKKPNPGYDKNAWDTFIDIAKKSNFGADKHHAVHVIGYSHLFRNTYNSTSNIQAAKDNTRFLTEINGTNKLGYVDCAICINRKNPKFVAMVDNYQPMHFNSHAHQHALVGIHSVKLINQPKPEAAIINRAQLSSVPDVNQTPLSEAAQNITLKEITEEFKRELQAVKASMSHPEERPVSKTRLTI